MKRPTRLLPAAALVVALACLDDASRRPAGPNAMIFDAAHNGTEGFYFLPPLVPQPNITHSFNAFLQPLVRICPLVAVNGVDQVQCPTAPIQFTRTTGTGSEVIRVSTVDRHYIVNWHTDFPPGVQPGERYRIEVFADAEGTVLLGFADIEIAATGKEAKNITNDIDGETIGLVDGKTLVIKFFVGIGALGACEATGPTCAEAIVPTSGGLVVAVNADGEAEAFADFPDGWNDEPTEVRLERITEFDDLAPATGPLGAPPTMRQWPLFYDFTAFEIVPGEGGPERVLAGQFNERVRIGVCNIESPFTNPVHPEDRSDLSLGIGGPREFRTLPLANAADILGFCEGVTLALHNDVEPDAWGALFASAVARATSIIVPRPLNAATTAVVVDGGMGGSTDSFRSPVGTVEGRPDLVVEAINVFPSGSELGDAFIITAEIRNNGTVHAGRFQVTIDVSGLPAFEEELWCPNLEESESALTASLAPFTPSEETCFVSRPVSLAGDFTVTTRADAVGDLVTESDEGNNERVFEFTAGLGSVDLVSPAANAVIPQNRSDIGCSLISGQEIRGHGLQILFDWADVAGAVSYDIFATDVDARIPIVNTTVTGSQYTHTACNSFVADGNLEGWIWRVRARDNAGNVGAWSEDRPFSFAPCRLADGTACRTAGAAMAQLTVGADFTLGIGGGDQSHQELAQVVTAIASGALTRVRFPVACEPTATLIVEIQGVADGKPNGTVLASQSFPGSTLPTPLTATFRDLAFSSPASVSEGSEFAIVLREPTISNENTCTVMPGPAGDPYPGGHAFFDARPNPAGWVLLFSGSDPATDDLPFSVIVQAPSPD